MSRRRRKKNVVTAGAAGLGRSTKGQTRAGRLSVFAPLFDDLLDDTFDDLFDDTFDDALDALPPNDHVTKDDPPPDSTQSKSTPRIVVDVGLGASPITLRQWRDHLSAFAPLHVVGIERERNFFEVARDAVESWAAIDGISTEIIHGGFEAIPNGSHLVRIANVLRVYPLSELASAEEAIAKNLAKGGVVVDITCDPTGAIGTALVSTKNTSGGLSPRAVVFAFRPADSVAGGGFAPWRFRDWLPRRYRRDCAAGSPFATFLDAWTAAWEDARSSSAPVRDAFERSCRTLESRRSDVDVRHVAQGLVRWVL